MSWTVTALVLHRGGMCRPALTHHEPRFACFAPARAASRSTGAHAILPLRLGKGA